jgi:hypothetical protein
MLGKEPHLERVAAEHVAHRQVVGPAVAVGRRAGHGVADLVTSPTEPDAKMPMAVSASL